MENDLKRTTHPVEKPAAPSIGMRRSQLRPANYNDLTPREQWEIDKRLGILDWDGS